MVQEAGRPCGQGLSATSAQELGLKSGIAVSASLIDAHCGAIGEYLIPFESLTFWNSLFELLIFNIDRIISLQEWDNSVIAFDVMPLPHKWYINLSHGCTFEFRLQNIVILNRKWLESLPLIFFRWVKRLFLFLVFGVHCIRPCFQSYGSTKVDRAQLEN